ncbi:sigma-54 interaction domain-containing protein [Oceanobacillus halophilus]|uniref:HTH-type transcriptional regulatory protein TyrR n=1 Tax=Oceanobacillus halophilus TaxID=930130 RepID=A0A494ZTN8_9BACI|nr:sigma 54-interacting transcriptional regulator [Oceanobacillus halophilus]RKQ29329.1 PAS domain S-box protein [Oceanobacillus halophilus]
MTEILKREITKLEKEVRELKMIFQLNSDEIFVTDANGICLMVNPIAEKHYGIKETQLIGKNVSEMLKNNLFNPSATLKVIEKRTPVNLIQSTHDNRWLHVTSVPVFNEQGNLVRIISNSRDITELFMLRRKIKEMEEIIEKYNLQLENLRKEKDASWQGFVVKSEKMINILNLVDRVAKVDSTILLLGESGVGKTNMAKLIHNKSTRNNAPFIEVNCSAIPPSLFESELFGYEAGAFTGASSAGQKGLLESAHDGTIFLDEISELSIELQTKLLQVIQNKSFLSVGGRRLKHVDIRIIAATNQDLEEMVKRKEFREDLFYRLSVVPIHIPPLRERKEDILNLTMNFLEKINKKYNFNKVLSPKMLESILSYSWPGNVRELENTVERLAVVTEDSVIDANLKFIFNKNYDEDYISLIESLDIQSQLNTRNNMSLNEMMNIFEEKILRHYMEKINSTSKVAEILQSSQSTISRKCIKYGISTQKR